MNITTDKITFSYRLFSFGKLKIFLSLYILLFISGCNQITTDLTINGKDIAIPSSEGWILINYWASWCSPCLKEIPELNELTENLPEPLAGVYGIYFDSLPIEEIMQKQEEFHVKYSMLVPMDEKYPSPRALPANYLIGPDGTIHGPLLGSQTVESIMSAIARFSAETTNGKSKWGVIERHR